MVLGVFLPLTGVTFQLDSPKSGRLKYDCSAAGGASSGIGAVVVVAGLQKSLSDRFAGLIPVYRASPPASQTLFRHGLTSCTAVFGRTKGGESGRRSTLGACVGRLVGYNSAPCFRRSETASAFEFG